MIDGFLQGPAGLSSTRSSATSWATILPTDGIDGSATISTVRPDGARTSFMYAGKKCRINTYGDSFTQCHQVSDGETWQEYLAAHLGEPVRNFGMGGYGAYQAYRRMVREERTGHGAEYLIFYIWGDDHIRSLLRCRHAVITRGGTTRAGGCSTTTSGPTWRLDLETGRFVEKENLLPTPESLYRMSDPRLDGRAPQGRPRPATLCVQAGAHPGPGPDSGSTSWRPIWIPR